MWVTNEQNQTCSRLRRIMRKLVEHIFWSSSRYSMKYNPKKWRKNYPSVTGWNDKSIQSLPCPYPLQGLLWYCLTAFTVNGLPVLQKISNEGMILELHLGDSSLSKENVMNSCRLWKYSTDESIILV